MGNGVAFYIGVARGLRGLDIRVMDTTRTTSTQTSIAWGDTGTIQTLHLMASLIDAGVDNPDVVTLARRLAVGAGVRQQRAQAFAIQQWLKRNWKFVDDPLDREMLRDPANMVREYAALGYVMGDCDEAAVLGSALGKAVGMGAELTVLAFGETDGRYSHVYADLLTDDGSRISLDVTKPVGPVPQVSRSLTIVV